MTCGRWTVCPFALLTGTASYSYRAVYNLDSMLSRMLSVPASIALASTHSGLPEVLDPDTEEWNAYFVFHQQPALGQPRMPTLSAGFALLCEANLLAMEAARELYPDARDRSEDWKGAEARTDLTLKVDGFERRLNELRAKVDGFVVPNGREVSIAVLSQAVHDLFAEVGLLIRRVQLPRQGPKATWDRAQYQWPLQPSLDIAVATLSDDSPRTLLPTSIYLALSVYNIFCTSLPLVHARIRVSSPTATVVEMDAATVDRFLIAASALLTQLQAVFNGAGLYAEGVKELRELSISWGERKNPGLKVKIGGKGKAKRPSSTSTTSSSTSGQTSKIEPLSPEMPMQIDGSSSTGGLGSPFSAVPASAGQRVQSPHRSSQSPYARPTSGGGPASKGKRPGSLPQQPPPSAYHGKPTKRTSFPNGISGVSARDQGSSRPRAQTMGSANHAYALPMGGSTINPQQLGNESQYGSTSYYQAPSASYPYGSTQYTAEAASAGNVSPYSNGMSPSTPAAVFPGGEPHVAGPWDGHPRRFSHDSADPAYGSSQMFPARLTYTPGGMPSRQAYATGVPPSYPSPSGASYDPYAGQSRSFPVPQAGRQSQQEGHPMGGSGRKQYLTDDRQSWEQTYPNENASFSSSGGFLNTYQTGNHQLQPSNSAASSLLGSSGLPVPSHPSTQYQNQQYSYFPAEQTKDGSISRSSSRGGSRSALGVSYGATRERYDSGGSAGSMHDVSMDGHSPGEWEPGPNR